jgi:hypothetical protein
MTQRRNTCRFCGDPGASREHIFAAWIGRVMAPPPVSGTEIVFTHRSENPAAGVAPRFKRAKGPAFYTRAFCRGCNGGWMSALEEEIMPVLGPMVTGRQRAIEVDDQRLLVFWAVKTALAFQTVEAPTTTFARDIDYVELFEPRRAPARARVWTGFTPSGDDAWYRSHSIRVPTSPVGSRDGFGVTMIVGHAILYVLIGDEHPVDVRLRGEAAFALRELASADRDRQLRWPPPAPLNVAHPGGLGEYVMGHARGMLVA